MATLPRERFLPAEVRGQAYRDTSIPLGEGRFANLPMATARLLNAADLHADDRVLLIGAAGGYTAAILSEIVATVTAVESLPALCALARGALADRSTVTLVEGPLANGAPDHAPYDVLIVDGAIERVPAAIVAQVRDGGRIAMGVVERGVTRLAAGRRSAGGFGEMPFMDCDCVILPGFDRPSAVWRTWAMLARAEKWMSPPSMPSSPEMAAQQGGFAGAGCGLPGRCGGLDLSSDPHGPSGFGRPCAGSGRLLSAGSCKRG